MAARIPRVPVREQDPKVRATNFEEVCYGYNEEEAVLEASRCLNCKNPRCMQACPVGVKIPAFISKVHEGDFAGAAAVIAEDSSLPAVCGRVCPQETQCEGSCILGVKSEPVAEPSSGQACRARQEREEGCRGRLWPERSCLCCGSRETRI